MHVGGNKWHGSGCRWVESIKALGVAPRREVLRGKAWDYAKVRLANRAGGVTSAAEGIKHLAIGTWVLAIEHHPLKIARSRTRSAYALLLTAVGVI